MIKPVSFILLFEELFECSGTENIDANFTLFETCIKQHKLMQLEKDPKQLINMELYCTMMCKTLMKKLSPTSDITFKSRIQTLLSSILPMNHKSGLNISGRFSDQWSQIVIDPQDEGISKEDYQTYFNFWTL